MWRMWRNSTELGVADILMPLKCPVQDHRRFEDGSHWSSQWEDLQEMKIDMQVEHLDAIVALSQWMRRSGNENWNAGGTFGYYFEHFAPSHFAPVLLIGTKKYCWEVRSMLLEAMRCTADRWQTWEFRMSTVFITRYTTESLHYFKIQTFCMILKATFLDCSWLKPFCREGSFGTGPWRYFLAVAARTQSTWTCTPP